MKWRRSCLLQAKWEAEEWAQLQRGHCTTIYVSRDGGIRVGEEYTYSLMPLLASDEMRPLLSVFWSTFCLKPQNHPTSVFWNLFLHWDSWRTLEKWALSYTPYTPDSRGTEAVSNITSYRFPSFWPRWPLNEEKARREVARGSVLLPSRWPWCFKSESKQGTSDFIQLHVLFTMILQQHSGPQPWIRNPLHYLACKHLTNRQDFKHPLFISSDVLKLLHLARQDLSWKVRVPVSISHPDGKRPFPDRFRGVVPEAGRTAGLPPSPHTPQAACGESFQHWIPYFSVKQTWRLEQQVRAEEKRQHRIWKIKLWQQVGLWPRATTNERGGGYSWRRGPARRGRASPGFSRACVPLPALPAPRPPLTATPPTAVPTAAAPPPLPSRPAVAFPFPPPTPGAEGGARPDSFLGGAMPVASAAHPARPAGGGGLRGAVPRPRRRCRDLPAAVADALAPCPAPLRSRSLPPPPFPALLPRPPPPPPPPSAAPRLASPRSPRALPSPAGWGCVSASASPSAWRLPIWTASSTLRGTRYGGAGGGPQRDVPGGRPRRGPRRLWGEGGGGQPPWGRGRPAGRWAARPRRSLFGAGGGGGPGAAGGRGGPRDDGPAGRTVPSPRPRLAKEKSPRLFVAYLGAFSESLAKSRSCRPHRGEVVYMAGVAWDLLPSRLPTLVPPGVTAAAGGVEGVGTAAVAPRGHQRLVEVSCSP